MITQKMLGKTVLVTGANSGMGLATTIALAQEGAQVILLCRDAQRGAQAYEKALQESRNEALKLMLCDLASMESIRQFADEFLHQFTQLDVLINNAGILPLKHTLTKDGFEMMMGVNHLGHFLLTHLLLPSLKAANQGRIINVSSGAHLAGNIHFPDPHLTHRFNPARGYTQSKLANVLYTRALSARLKDTSVTVNALHPGAVVTSLGISRKTGFGKGIYALLSPFFLNALEGSQTAIYLATSEDVRYISGQYFYQQAMYPISKKAQDNLLVEHFWQWSKQQVKL